MKGAVLPVCSGTSSEPTVPACFDSLSSHGSHLEADEEFLEEQIAETTSKQKAALLVDAAVALGILDDLAEEVARRRAIMSIATNSPCPDERREEPWGGEEKGTASEALTNTDANGESSLLDQMGDDMWRAFRQKVKPKKR